MKKTQHQSKKHAQTAETLRRRQMGLTEAIKRDHEDLKKFIEVLKDEDAEQEEKKEAYLPFMRLLESHTESEEKALYTLTFKIAGLSEKGHEAQVEHDLAKEMIQSIGKTRKKEIWMAKVKVLAELVEHHIEEEEESFLPEVEEQMEEELKEQALDRFLELRQRTQPEYSTENSGVLAA